MRARGAAHRAALAIAALLIGTVARVDAAPASALLARMNTALRMLDYQGSFIYEHDGRTDALRIFHLGGLHERERLVSLTGPRSEIVRSNGVVTCLTPRAAAPTEFPNAGDLRLLPIVPNVHAFGGQYEIADGDEDRVAGYAARIVDVSPRDRWRYGYRLWIETNSHLPLRSAVIDERGRVLEQFMFVALDIGAKPSAADLGATDDAAKAVAPADEIADAGAPVFEVGSLPPGFRLVRVRQRKDDASGAEHLVYSDGVASVSVYVEPAPGASGAAAESSIRHGVLSIDSRHGDGLRVTAVGDVPPVTVRAMTRSVRRTPDRPK